MMQEQSKKSQLEVNGRERAEAGQDERGDRARDCKDGAGSEEKACSESRRTVKDGGWRRERTGGREKEGGYSAQKGV